MAEKENLINQSNTKPIKWKRYIDDIFSLPDSNRQEIDLFIKLANNFHATIKFTAEVSEMEIKFLDTIISKGERFRNESILDIRTHYKPIETFQYTHFTSSYPPGVKKGFIKGDALRLLRTLLKQPLMTVSQILNRASSRAVPQAAQAHFMNHTRNTIWRRCIRVCMGFSTNLYKISMKVVKSENIQ